MSRNLVLRALAASALVAASGCSRDTDFDLKKTFHVDVTSPLTYDRTESIDLAAEAGTAWKHRDKLKSVKVVNATAVASNVIPASGTTGSGSASLIPGGGGAPVPIGSWTDIPIVAGSWVDVPGSDALNKALNDALEGDGQLSFQLAGNASQPFQADVEVTLRVTVEYSISPF